MFRFPRNTDRKAPKSHEDFLEQEGLLTPLPKPKPLSFAEQRYHPKLPTKLSEPTNAQPDSAHRTPSAHSNASSFFGSFTPVVFKKHVDLAFDGNDRHSHRSEIPYQHRPKRSQPVQHVKGHAFSRLGFLGTPQLKAKATVASQRKSLQHLSPQPPSYEESQHTDIRATDPLPPVFGRLPGLTQDNVSIRYDQPGAAAREAAAVQNKLENRLREIQISTMDNIQDSESCIGVEFAKKIIKTSSPTERDPARRLPAELMLDVLANLDAHSLMSAERVSKQWLRLAKGHRVWKQIFYAEFKDTFDDNFRSYSVKSISANYAKSRDWKALWQTRSKINRRWELGRAGAIYLEGHNDSVYCVQFDREIIVTGSRDRTIRIWATQSHQCLRVLGVPTTREAELKPLPMTEFKAGQKPIARVFPLPSSTEDIKASDIYHEGSILCLQYDKKILVTGSADCTLVIWSWRPDFDCTPIQQLRGHLAAIFDVSFDDHTIISGSKDLTLGHWDRSTGNLVRKLRGHVGAVNAVKVRGKLAISASYDGTTRVWDLVTGGCVRSFSRENSSLACVEVNFDASIFYAGGNSRTVYQFDSQRVLPINSHEDLVRSLHLDSSNHRLISGSYDKTVKAFDLRTSLNLFTFGWTSSHILCVKSDYRRIIATGQDGRIVIMDFGYGIPAANLLEGWR